MTQMKLFFNSSVKLLFVYFHTVQQNRRHQAGMKLPGNRPSQEVLVFIQRKENNTLACSKRSVT